LIETAPDDWPSIVTSRRGHHGFWRELTPAVFGHREGIGPLVVMPDTSVLIEFREYMDRVGDGALIAIAPNWSPLRDRLDAMQDLVQLWWSRDLRFAVSAEHLADGKMNELRTLAREAAVRELERDYWERGGLAPFLSEEEALAEEDIDQPCAWHCAGGPRPSSDSVEAQEWRWPKDEPDRSLARAAYDAGCHIFLTSDKDILKCHPSLFSHGMAVLSPRQLIDALGRSGELEKDFGMHSPAADVSTLSTLAVGFPESE
jgi:hypothetical protein